MPFFCHRSSYTIEINISKIQVHRLCIFQTTLKTLQTEFEFLIQKLHRKTLYMFPRKDRFLYQEPNKIGFAFFWFSTIFNNFSKVQPGHPRSENWFLTNRSLGFAFQPLERPQTSQCGPDRGHGWRWPESGEGKTVLGWETVGGGSLLT
jgi:hypothetical protein